MFFGLQMPEMHDKHGPPKLWATVKCLVPECSSSRLVGPEQAERLAHKLSVGVTVRYYLTKLKCSRCGFRNASLAFHLAYAGKRPWEGWRKKGASPHPRVFPHQRGSDVADLDDTMSKLHRNLPVVHKGMPTKRRAR